MLLYSPMSSEELIFDYTASGTSQKTACLSEECFAGYSSPEDIYDLATDIGHDFEKLIQSYGFETFSIVLPKVVHALEHLEAAYKKAEMSHCKVAEMRQTILALEKERNQRNSDRLKFENDVDELETQWKHEKIELTAAVRRLTEENMSLEKQLETRAISSVPLDISSRETSPANSTQSLAEHIESRKAVAELEERMTQLSHELNDKKDECEELLSQVDRMSRQNATVLEQNDLLRRDIDQLLEEKTELEDHLSLAEKKVHHFTTTINAMRQKEKDELEISQMSALQVEAAHRGTRNEEVRYAVTGEIISHSALERHFSLDDSSIATPLPDLNLSESEERMVYGPINREPDDKLFDDGRTSAGNKSIRDLYVLFF